MRAIRVRYFNLTHVVTAPFDYGKRYLSSEIQPLTHTSAPSGGHHGIYSAYSAHRILAYLC